MSAYWELLKHPEWQRKRLEILESAGFACSSCGDNQRTLHVHHGYYQRGVKPWEYPDESLHCLCEACHVEIQHATLLAHQAIALMSLTEIWRVTAYARAVIANEYQASAEEAANYEQCQGVADYHRMPVDSVVEAALAVR